MRPGFFSTLAVGFLSGLVMLAAVTLLFVGQTESGTRLLVQQVAERLEFLAVEEVSGRLGGQVVLGGLAINTASTSIKLDRVDLDISLAALLRRQITFSRLAIRGLEIVYQSVETQVDEEPFVMAWPLRVLDGSVSNGVVVIGDETISIAEFRASLSLSRQDLSVTVEELALLAPQAVTVSGSMDLVIAAPFEFHGNFEARELVSMQGLVPGLTALGSYQGNAAFVAVDPEVRLPEAIELALRLDLGETINLDLKASAGSLPMGETRLKDHRLTIAGPLDALELTGSLDVDDPAAGEFHATYHGFFDQRVLKIDQLMLAGEQVDLAFMGAIDTLDQRVTVTGRGLVFDRAVTAELATSGFDLAGLDGSLQLQMEDNTLLAVARPGQGIDLNGTVLGTRVTGNVSLADGGYRIGAEAARAVYGEWQLEALDVSASGMLPDDHRLQVKTDSLMRNDVLLGSGSMDYAGTLSSGNARLNWQYPGASLEASGMLSTAGSGSLTEAVLLVGDQRLELSEALMLQFVDTGTRIPRHCWDLDQGAADICLSGVVSASTGFLELDVPDLSVGPSRFSSVSGRLNYSNAEQFGMDFNLTSGLLVPLLSTDTLDLQLSGTYVDDVLRLPVGRITGPNLNLELTLDYVSASAAGQAALSGTAWDLAVNGTGTFDGHSEESPTAAVQLAAEGVGRLDLNLGNGKLTLQGDLSGLQKPELSVHRAVIDATVSDWERLEARLDVGGLTISGYDTGGGFFSAGGDLSALDMGFQWSGPFGGANLAAQVAAVDNGVEGRLQSGEITLPGQSWELDGQVPFLASSEGLSVSDHCWRQAGGSACFSKLVRSIDQSSLSIDIKDAPVNYASLPFAPEVAVDGLIAGSIELLRRSGTSEPEITGSMNINIPALRLRYYEDEMVWSVTANSALKNDAMTVAATASSGASNRFELNGSVPDFSATDRFLLSGDLKSDSLSVITAFIPMLDRATGSIEAKARIDTRSGTPETTLSATVGDDASVAIPAAGIMLEEVSLAVSGDSDMIQLDLSARSGAGTLTGQGTIKEPLSAERKLTLALKGDAVTVMDRPEIRLIASPDLVFEAQGPGTSMLSGALAVDSGYFRQADFGSNVRWASPDVVIQSDSQPQGSESANVALQLALSIEAFDIDLYGLQGELQGEVALSQPARKPRRAVGELNLRNGTFSRYGQEFEVARGRLIFAGSLTNPGVDIVSTRTIVDRDRTVTVSLNLTGPANNIRSTLVSSPAMSEANALSYLVIGRSLSTASASDGSSLTGAAVALGLRRVAPVTDEIRSMLGLSELTLETGVDSTTVIAGKQFGSALYVVYSYDMLGRIGGILFSYQLSDRLSLETRSGEDKSMQLIYTFD